VLEIALFAVGLFVWAALRPPTFLRVGAIIGLLVVVCVLTEFKSDADGVLLPSAFTEPGLLAGISNPDLVLLLATCLAGAGWVGVWFLWPSSRAFSSLLVTRLRRRLGSYGFRALVVLGVLLLFSWSRSLLSPASLGSTYELRLLLYFGLPFLAFTIAGETIDCEIVSVLLLLLASIKGMEAFQLLRDVPSDFVGRYSIFPGWGESAHFVLALLGVVSIIARAHRDAGVHPRRSLLLIAAGLAASSFLFWLLLNSFRRSFFVGLLVSFLALLIAIPLSARSPSKRWLGRLGVGVVGIGAFVVIIVTMSGQSQAVVARFASLFHPAQDPSLLYRIAEYQNVLLSVRAHPFLGLPFGVPWNQIVPLPFAEPVDPIGTHNVTLWFMLKGGVLGGVCYWVLVGSIGWRLRNALVRVRVAPQGSREAAVITAYLSVLIALFVVSMSAPLIAERKSAFLFGLFLGMAAARADLLVTKSDPSTSVNR
jgi:O-antigen ligase